MSKIDELRDAIDMPFEASDILVEAARAFLALLDGMPRPSPKNIDPNCEFSKGWDHCLTEIKVLIPSEWWEQ